MVKMILALPKHVDSEKLVELVMDTIKGRYGRHGYFNGVELRITAMFYPCKSAEVYAVGFSGKGSLRYYEIEAAELDPVIIATIEEFINVIGNAEYSFTMGNKFLCRDWWKPARKEFQMWNGEPYYNNDDAREIADEYFERLEMLDSTFKSPSRLEYERREEWQKKFA